MESIQRVIRQDMLAGITAFEKDNFSDMNMFANRLMANAAFGDTEGLILPGFFLKEVAGMFLMLKAMPNSALSTAKTLTMKYLKALKEGMSGEKPNVELLWISFFQFYRDTRKFLVTDIEKKVYVDDIDFTRQAFIQLTRYMEKKKELLLDPNNRLLKGVLNEFNRIFRNHSGELVDVFATFLVSALDRVYNYVAISKTHEGKIDKGKLEKFIFPYIENMEQLIYRPEKPLIAEISHTICILTKQWREFFVQYMEWRRFESGIERAIELPAEMKKKLAESVSKTLETEIKLEGRKS